VRALVARSAGGPRCLATPRIDEPKMRTTDFCPSLESNGHPDPLGYRGPRGVRFGRRLTAPLRASVVQPCLESSVIFSSRCSERAPPLDTPVALRACTYAELRFARTRRAKTASPRTTSIVRSYPGRGCLRPFSCPSRSEAFRDPRLWSETPVTRHWKDDATRHMIRSHSRTLVSSRVIVARLCVYRLRDYGSAPDHTALLHAFVPEERNSS
jgi:hypothetical protein